MICSNCKTFNDDENVFCVKCGWGINSGAASNDFTSGKVPVTAVYNDPQTQSSGRYEGSPANSIETELVHTSPHHRSRTTFNPAPNRTGEHTSRLSNRSLLWFGLGLVAAIALAAGGFFFLDKPSFSPETLPDHLGLFVQSKERDRLDEIKKLDLVNAVEAKESLLKNESLPTLDTNPNLILYSDGKYVPLNDLRLIQIDTINRDGSFNQIDFQASPVEGRPEMKRLRIPDGLANGTYAFALLEGFLNDGKHKFWPFRVLNASKSDNGDSLKVASVQVKPTVAPPTAVSRPTAPTLLPPPVGSGAYSSTGNLILRSGASQTSAKIRNLRRGERVYILEYSSNIEVFQGRASRFAYVQTENGQRGWVFAAFLR
jgi:hypothetical protein